MPHDSVDDKLTKTGTGVCGIKNISTHLVPDSERAAYYLLGHLQVEIYQFQVLWKFHWCERDEVAYI